MNSGKSTSTSEPFSPSVNSTLSTSTSASSPTLTSPCVSEKMALRSQLVVMNPNPVAAPPSAYTPSSLPTASSSTSHLPPPAPAPMPTVVSSGQPQLCPAPSQPISPGARQSLFLPRAKTSSCLCWPVIRTCPSRSSSKSVPCRTFFWLHPPHDTHGTLRGLMFTVNQDGQQYTACWNKIYRFRLVLSRFCSRLSLRIIFQ